MQKCHLTQKKSQNPRKKGNKCVNKEHDLIAIGHVEQPIERVGRSRSFLHEKRDNSNIRRKRFPFMCQKQSTLPLNA